MYLCTFVSKEGGDGEGADTEASSLLSYTLRYVNLEELGNYTLRYVNLAELGSVCRVGL
jgi:hypothetical protein